jgi:PBSX family phage portal protein
LIQRKGTTEDNDRFVDLYDANGLIEPRYPFANLYDIYEESDVLRSCVEAYVANIDGCPHEFDFLGDDLLEKDNPTFIEQLTNLQDFFDAINEEESFTLIREKFRRDLEVTGNAVFEVMRDLAGSVQRLYHVPITYFRMSELSPEAVPVTRSIPRNGKLVTVTAKKRFRKFARIINNEIVWFKEFGDPRTLNSRTGAYSDLTPPEEVATEIWWFKIPLAGHPYGAPRWIGAIKTIKGRCLAEFVNYDIFLNQGIPPIAIKVMGGKLSDASWDDIENGFEQWRDVSKFNRTLVLHVVGDQDSGFDTGSNPRVEIEKLRDGRAEDYLFENYLRYSENSIRKVFRLPPVYLGSDDNSYSSAYISQFVAEQQVFDPLRLEFDEKVNNLLIRSEFGVTKWRFKSGGPQITGTEQFSRIINALSRGLGISPNYMIRLANQIMGTKMSLFKDKWADLPSELVKLYASQGKLIGEELDKIVMNNPLELTALATTEETPSEEVAKADHEVKDASKLLYEAILAVEDEIRNVEPKPVTEANYIL